MLTRRFLSRDGTPLCADTYEPQGGALGLLCLIHGYCEHRGRHRHTASDLARAGYRVIVPDLRGHGESGGQRAHVLRFGEYLEDLDATLDACAPGERPVLLGHSMGGLVAALYALERPHRLRALALVSPFLGIKLTLPPWKVLMGELASRIFPGLTLPVRTDPAHLSHDAAVGAAYAADPLVSHLATARWFTEAVAAHAEVSQRAQALLLPLLLLLAGDDRIADPQASRTFFDNVGSRKKVLITYPGLYHEILNEVDRERVLQDLLRWLEVGMDPESGLPGGIGAR